MCGICGEYNFGDGRPSRLSDLRQRTAAIAHRGPDDDGYFCRGPVGFGFRRLSIIDLSGGHQPMTDDEEKVWLVFNGEIYNFQELRAELQSKGYRFKTRSDTEVILHGYKEWGIDVLHRLNGMFGLAIWDEPNRRLMLARDRLGIKPLYYRLQRDHIAFGSEIRAITALDLSRPDVNVAALNLFLRYRYTPAPLTPFKGISKLAAGTRLIVENGAARVERWWNFQPVPFDPMPAVDEAEEELLDLYRKAVRRQLISDVPVGLFLSGGLDSSLLLGLMREISPDWNAYSVGFGNAFSNDELSTAAGIARHFDSNTVAIELTKNDFEKTLHKSIAAVEEPVAADSILPMYFLCQRAREDVKVALMGQGPDELFGGYRRHLFVKYSSYMRMMPWSSEWLLRPALRYTVGKTTTDRIFASLRSPDGMARYRAVFSQVDVPDINALFYDDGPSKDADVFHCWQDLQPLMSATDELGSLQVVELRSSLPDELLMYADKLSMAHGLEIRVPYLDHTVVEFVERLSSSFKIRNGSQKWLHRRLCRRFVPKRLVSRNKIGFETPTNEWFRQGSNGTFAECLLDRQSRMYQYLRFEGIESLFAQHQRGESQHSAFLFSLVALELWLRSSCN